MADANERAQAILGPDHDAYHVTITEDGHRDLAVALFGGNVYSTDPARFRRIAKSLNQLSTAGQGGYIGIGGYGSQER